MSRGLFFKPVETRLRWWFMSQLHENPIKRSVPMSLKHSKILSSLMEQWQCSAKRRFWLHKLSYRYYYWNHTQIFIYFSSQRVSFSFLVAKSCTSIPDMIPCLQHVPITRFYFTFHHGNVTKKSVIKGWVNLGDFGLGADCLRKTRQFKSTRFFRLVGELRWHFPFFIVTTDLTDLENFSVNYRFWSWNCFISSERWDYNKSGFGRSNKW